ncbi:hypothetical protein [Geomonas propionica]|uniref:Secreted peptide n=1 Tax=Geomonas propionica TaxID=2798582 RepID=A0ABS0YTJ6_9BACT|nr:hypothetical protein [Geomonas propionica]MBJ6801301.1 hypothetical protein [Geomonas propionica]
MAHYSVPHSVIALLFFLCSAAPAAISLFSGFLLPRLLHYNHLDHPKSEKKDSNSIIKRLSFRALISAASAGLACEMRY